MQTKITRFLMSWVGAFLLAPAALQAGHSTTSGGGVSCPPEYGGFTELLDIWEGRRFRKLDYVNFDDSKSAVEQYIAFAAQTLSKASNPTLGERIAERALKLYRFRDRFGIFTDKDIAISPPTDTSARFLPKGCSLVGIANFNGQGLSGNLRIDGDNFNKLSPLNQAALFIHEVIYEYLLERHDLTDSRPVRLLTGCSLSANGCEELNVLPANDVGDSSMLVCSSPPKSAIDVQLTFLYMVPFKGESSTVAYVTAINGERNAFRSSFVVHHVNKSKRCENCQGPMACQNYYPVASTEYEDWGRTGLPSRLRIEAKTTTVNGEPTTTYMVEGVTLDCVSASR